MHKQWLGALLALVVGSLAGCKTLPINPGAFRPAEVPLAGAPHASPVALLVTATDSPEANFVAHHLGRQSASVFPDRVVIFDEAALGSRSLIRVDTVNVRKVDGFFNDDMEVTVSGFVQKAGGTRVPVSVTHMASMEMGIPSIGIWVGSLILPLAAALASFFFVTSWAGFGLLYTGMLAGQAYGNHAHYELQQAVDRSCSGAVSRFLAGARDALGGSTPAVESPPPSQPKTGA